MRIGVAAVVLALCTYSYGATSDAERKELEAWARGLDRDAVHKAVLHHEREPLSKEAKTNIRPVLVVHFEPLDYTVCLDQIGSLLDSKKPVDEAVFWQVVFGSGDFFEANPGADKIAYMVAGLESGMRAYDNILRENPKNRSESLDKLRALRDKGELVGFVKGKPCD